MAVNGSVMVTQTAAMALMKPIVTTHVPTTSLLAKISSVLASLGAVMEMTTVVITQMKPNVRLLLALQVGTGQHSYLFIHLFIYGLFNYTISDCLCRLVQYECVCVFPYLNTLLLMVLKVLSMF